MVHISLDATAVPAWYPRADKTMIAAGTVAGAMDASFSNSSTLEITEILGSSTKVIAKTSAPGRFHRLAWSTPSDTYKHGLLAGGLENGQLCIWDPAQIVASYGASESTDPIFSSSNHTGNVCGLEFNRFQSNLLASGAENGQILIWDVANEFKSYSPGNRSNRIESVSDLSWNNQVQQIIATSSNTGSTVVWDLRHRREVMTLTYSSGMGMDMSMGMNSGMSVGRSGVSAVNWHPSSATQLVTSLDDDKSPVILLWDLRNANAPSQIFQGHSRGVLSLSWCEKDPSLLLSSGKDNRTICWDPTTGNIVSELPQSNNWVFNVQWNQSNPNLISTASFEGKIGVYQISSKKSEHKNEYVADPFDINANLTANDSLVLRNSPKWLSRPCGASFGFGNKLTYFNNQSTNTSIYQIVSEPSLASRAIELESKLNDAAESLSNERLQEAGNTQEVNEWSTLSMLFQPDAREKLIQTLGFDKQALSTKIREIIKPKESQKTQSNDSISPPDLSPSVEATISQDTSDNQTRQPAESMPFGDDAIASSDVFLQSIRKESDSIVDTIAELNVNPEPNLVQFTGQFPMSEKESEVNDLILKSLFLGNIEDSVSLCVEYDRFDDALMLASCSGPELTQKVQKAYFTKHASSSSYFRLMYSIYSSDLSDAVKNTDVNEWRETLALLCTYAQDVQFGYYCGQLGQRLEAAFAQSDDQNLMWGALVCYLVSGNLARITSIWVKRHQSEESHKTNASSISALKSYSTLHKFIEKISILRAAINFEDPTLSQADSASNSQEYPLSTLYSTYFDYAEFLVSQGMNSLAVQFLSKIPAGFRFIDAFGEDRIASFKYRLYMTGVYWNQMPKPEPGFIISPLTASRVAQVETQQPTQSQQPHTGYQYQPTSQFNRQTFPQSQQFQQQVPQPMINASFAQQQKQQQQFGSYQQSQSQPNFPPNAQPGMAQNSPLGFHPGLTPASMVPQPPNQSSYLNNPSAFNTNQGVNQFNTSMAGSAAPANPIIPPPEPVNYNQQPAPPAAPSQPEVAWNDPPMIKNAKATFKPTAPKPPAIPSPFPHGRNTPPGASAAAFAENRNIPGPPPMGQQNQTFAPPPQRKVPPPNQFANQPPVAPIQPMQRVNHNFSQQPPAFPQQPNFPQPQTFPQQPNFAATTFSPALAAQNNPPQAIRGVVVPQQHPGQRVRGQQHSSSPKPQSPAAGALQSQFKYPPGDRSNIPDVWKPIYSKLSAQLEKAQRFTVPSQKRIVEDCAKRLNQLFDMMNNDAIKLTSGANTPVYKSFNQLTNSVDTKNFQQASVDVTEIMSLESSLTGAMLGVKRMVDILKTLPV